MSFFIYVFIGFLLGIGAIAPGVSGGSLAVMFGLYEKFTYILANMIKNIKKNIVFLTPLAIGGALGILLCSRLIKFLFENYEIPIKYLFIGLMAGSLPVATKQASSKGFKIKYLIPLIITLSITTIFVFIGSSSQNTIISVNNPSFYMRIIYGAIIGFGTIIPGISASFVLMYLGVYETLISAILNFDIVMLLPVCIGSVAAIIIFAKIVNLMFKKMHGYTHFAILGFAAGSIVAIFPGVYYNVTGLISFGLLISGFFATYYLGKIEIVNKGCDVI